MKCCANLARSASAKPDPVRWSNWRAPKRSRLRLSGTARRELEMKTGAPVLPFSFSDLDARQSGDVWANVKELLRRFRSAAGTAGWYVGSQLTDCGLFRA